MGRTRRDLLRTGGIALTTASLAGCLGFRTTNETATSTSGGGDSDTPTPTATPTATDAETATDAVTATDAETATPAGPRPATPTAGLTDWLPAPSAVDGVDGGYAFRSLAPRALSAFADSLGDGALEGFDQSTQLPGLETVGDATALHQFARSVTTVVTEFDRETVESEFEGLGFSAADTRHGYTVMTAPDPRALAVGDGAMVIAGSFGSSDEADKRPLVEAVVDAKTGNGARYVDGVADCGRLAGALGNGHVVQGRTHAADEGWDGVVGEGTTTHVAPDRTRIRASVVFAEGRVDRALVADWAGETGTFLDGEPVVTTDGRTVSATALVPTGEVTGFDSEFPGPALEPDGPTTAPQVSWAAEYEETGDGRGVLTLTHEGGDNVPREALFVRGSGFADVDGVDQTSAGQWQGSASSDDSDVRAGDAVAVGVTSDYEIRLVWEATEGGRSATLFSDEGPDA